MKVRIPSPAMIVAILALLFALSGTAVAGGLITGAQIQNNTVSSADLTNNGVKSVDMQNNAVTTFDVLNGTLRAVDFAPGVLTSGAAGPAGPAGPAGAQGAPGPQGAPGLAGLEIVTADGVSNSDNAEADRGVVPGRQADRRRRRSHLQRRRRRGARRELPGERDEVARDGVRDRRHGRELAPRGLCDLRHGCRVATEHDRGDVGAAKAAPTVVSGRRVRNVRRAGCPPRPAEVDRRHTKEELR